ncbi:unnamed protein product [Citrullus colocynthis]|uniref:BHLH domain-containing protein n=1 Tax=Citrullus colocynthis TaxID=252529 RepID=A0ABP0Y9N5_9ROSI
MSARSSRSRRSGVPSRNISDDQIADLISKLQQLIPEIRNGRSSSRVSASKVLQETCNYIRSLQREVDDLSDRLSELLASTDPESAQAAIIRSLLILDGPAQLSSLWSKVIQTGGGGFGASFLREFSQVCLQKFHPLGVNSFIFLCKFHISKKELAN